METNHRINSIDIARLFAAILVIAIHTQAIMWFSDRANGNIQILTRVAVPFFFCTSGYFLQKGYVRKGCSAIATSIWKVFRLYVALPGVVTKGGKMDADRFPVQWQLLSSMVHGGGHLFHGNDLPDLQI